MSTKDLIKLLSKQTAKADYLTILEERLKNMFRALYQKGYKLNLEVGFTEKQQLNPGDWYLYQEFRDNLFIYRGLHGEWAHDSNGDNYFHSIKEEVLSHYDDLPDS